MNPASLFLFLCSALLYASGANAFPSAAPATTLDFVVPAGFKCDLVGGKLVCGKKQGGQDDDGDEDHHGKHSKDKDTGLSECTIQQPGSGGGCKTGFKWVCEKMKSGKKCCGCVADSNAKAQPQPAPEPAPQPAPAETPNPAAERVCCTASHPSGEPQKFCGLLNDARKQAGAARFNGEPAQTIMCTPE